MAMLVETKEVVIQGALGRLTSDRYPEKHLIIDLCQGKCLIIDLCLGKCMIIGLCPGKHLIIGLCPEKRHMTAKRMPLTILYPEVSLSHALRLLSCYRNVFYVYCLYLANILKLKVGVRYSLVAVCCLLPFRG